MVPCGCLVSSARVCLLVSLAAFSKFLLKRVSCFQTDLFLFGAEPELVLMPHPLDLCSAGTGSLSSSLSPVVCLNIFSYIVSLSPFHCFFPPSLRFFPFHCFLFSCLYCKNKYALISLRFCREPTIRPVCPPGFKWKLYIYQSCSGFYIISF